VQLTSVRDLKVELLTSLVREANEQKTLGGERLTSPAVALSLVDSVQPSLALGLHPRGNGEYWLAVRIQRPELRTRPFLERIRSVAGNEVDIRYVGQVRPEAGKPDLRGVCRPLVIGCSIGHSGVTAGTLGAFARGVRDDITLALSCAHVLAPRGAKLTDSIVQPGRFDDGTVEQHTVGVLAKQFRVNKDSSNLVDAAAARVLPDIEADRSTIHKPGKPWKLRGVSNEQMESGQSVFKLGRTSDWTAGMITAIEMDNVVVRYPRFDNLRFDGQIEIQGVNGPFSLPGDSGSLILNSDCFGIGLLFAGTESVERGLSYANPLSTVLDVLRTDLVVE
jgi:hypothetical protein